MLGSMTPIKAYTGHIVLGDKYSYKHLARVYPDIYQKVVEAGANTVPSDGPAMAEIILDDNLKALKADKKPAGLNRIDTSGVKLIFPIRDDRKVEFYVSKHARCPEVVGLTETISTILNKAGLKHTTLYDHTPLSLPRTGFTPTPTPP